MRPRSLSVSAFGAASLGAFGLVCLEGETIRRIVDYLLVAVWAELFLFPWGFVPITVVTVAAFAFSAAAAAVAAATLGECCMSIAFCAMTSNTCLHCSTRVSWRSVRGSKAGGMGVHVVASEANVSRAAVSDSSLLSM